ncbi:MAG: hypothetical protein DHS20C02_19460 [Micavibrio sp.]|nr:MAG: hypothetical protein DHS20C02_19460 [Micavibrio sp.]
MKNRNVLEKRRQKIREAKKTKAEKSLQENVLNARRNEFRAELENTLKKTQDMYPQVSPEHIVKINELKMYGSELKGFGLRGANFKSVNFFEAQMQGIDMQETNLVFANLSQGDFTGADFTGADLRQATMIHTNLNGALLDNTKLPFESYYKADGRPAEIPKGARFYLNDGQEVIGFLHDKGGYPYVDPNYPATGYKLSDFFDGLAEKTKTVRFADIVQEAGLVAAYLLQPKKVEDCAEEKQVFAPAA